MTGYCDDELGECICKVGYFGKDCEIQVRLNTRQYGAGNRYGYVEMSMNDQTSWKPVWTDSMDANLATPKILHRVARRLQADKITKYRKQNAERALTGNMRVSKKKNPKVIRSARHV